ncbi:MAG: nuclear transport factor 2 family protein [Blastocatellales bacterium]
MKITFLLLVLLLALTDINAQSKEDSELFKTLKAKDELLFNQGFNNCDINQLENLVGDNFEFYHDQSGITDSKEAFIKSIRDGICKLSYKPRRELVEGSLEVYPLKNNGVLYGAIQSGKHRFYAIEKDKPEYLTSEARFTHLWKLEEGEWKLIRVLSYAHQPAKKKENGH